MARATSILHDLHWLNFWEPICKFDIVPPDGIKYYMISLIRLSWSILTVGASLFALENALCRVQGEDANWSLDEEIRSRFLVESPRFCGKIFSFLPSIHQSLLHSLLYSSKMASFTSSFVVGSVPSARSVRDAIQSCEHFCPPWTSQSRPHSTHDGYC